MWAIRFASSKLDPCSTLCGVTSAHSDKRLELEEWRILVEDVLRSASIESVEAMIPYEVCRLPNLLFRGLTRSSAGLHRD